jgi:hypothetical protein
MTIDVKVNLEKDVTIFIVKGKISFKEFMAELQSFYDGKPTRYTVWDLGLASVWDITVNQIKILAQYPPRINKSRPGAKTAFVTMDELTISLSKLFGHYGQSKGLQTEIENFKTMDEALEWFGDS